MMSLHSTAYSCSYLQNIGSAYSELESFTPLCEHNAIDSLQFETEMSYQNVFEQVGTAILVADAVGRVLLANPHMAALSGYASADLRELKHWTRLLDTRQQHRIINWMAENHASSSFPRCFESTLKCKNGTLRPVYVTVAAYQPENCLLVSLVDISELKTSDLLLYHKAFHDHLTGLPNRALFMEVLELALRRSRRSRDYLFSVLFFDMDRFKAINDVLGHSVGDRLLKEFAETIKQCLRDSDLAARLGGDEFIVILNDIRELTYTSTVVNRIFTRLKKPLNLDSHQLCVQISMGIVADCRHYELADDILRDVDAAMYDAKAAGGSGYKVFEPQMHHRFQRIQELEAALRAAIRNEEFILYYQPIVVINTGSIASFEALIRWERPGMGLVAPAEFLPIAEETGLIFALGHWVLRKACNQMKQWQLRCATLTDCSICVNLTLRQLQDPGLEEMIREVLEDSQLAPYHLQLEITEIRDLPNPEEIIDTLLRLRELGIRIMLDDFGTGSSSLNFLHRFPIDVLKVDRSFVARLDAANASEDQKIVELFISLARRLNLAVVAEGVERTTQKDILAGLDCQFAQGFLYYRPMPPEMIQTDYLKRVLGLETYP